MTLSPTELPETQEGEWGLQSPSLGSAVLVASPRALGHAAFPSEPQFPLLFCRMRCIKTRKDVGSCSQNERTVVITVTVTCENGTMQQEDLIFTLAWGRHTGLSLGPGTLLSGAGREMAAVRTQGVESSQRTVFPSPLHLAELILVPLPSPFQPRARALWFLKVG